MLGQFVRFVLKLVLAAFGLVFAISLLAAALMVVVLSLFKALLTGKKPAPAMVFSRFQKISPGGMWPGAAGRDGAGKAAASGEVVDVEVREIREIRDDKPKS